MKFEPSLCSPIRWHTLTQQTSFLDACELRPSVATHTVGYVVVDVDDVPAASVAAAPLAVDVVTAAAPLAAAAVVAHPLADVAPLGHAASPLVVASDAVVAPHYCAPHILLGLHPRCDLHPQHLPILSSINFPRYHRGGAWLCHVRIMRSHDHNSEHRRFHN